MANPVIETGFNLSSLEQMEIANVFSKGRVALEKVRSFMVMVQQQPTWPVVATIIKSLLLLVQQNTCVTVIHYTKTVHATRSRAMRKRFLLLVCSFGSFKLFNDIIIYAKLYFFELQCIGSLLTRHVLS